MTSIRLVFLHRIPPLNFRKIFSTGLLSDNAHIRFRDDISFERCKCNFYTQRSFRKLSIFTGRSQSKNFIKCLTFNLYPLLRTKTVIGPEARRNLFVQLPQFPNSSSISLSDISMLVKYESLHSETEGPGKRYAILTITNYYEDEYLICSRV